MKTVIVAAACVVAVLLAACGAIGEAPGPNYKVEYLFKPPATEDGRRCAAGCEKIRQLCETEAKQDGAHAHRSCEQQAADDYELCVGRTTSISEKSACYRKACPVSPDYVNCESGYRGCFERCGGEIWTRTVCETC